MLVNPDIGISTSVTVHMAAGIGSLNLMHMTVPTACIPLSACGNRAVAGTVE